MIFLRCLLFSSLLSWTILSPCAQAGGHLDQAQKLFSKMQHAVRTLDYRGVFVYQNGSELSTLKIEHAWFNGKSYERLVSEDGARREVLMNGDLVTYVRPAHKSVVIMHRDNHPALPNHYALKQLPSDYYHLALGVSKRVAGQSCQILMLKPEDPYRYEHQMCIAVSNSLPLESEVIDRLGRPVERMMYTSIELDTHLKPAFFKPPVLGPQYTLRWVRSNSRDVLGSGQNAFWNLKKTVLPPGFELRAKQTHHFSVEGDPVYHFVLSDGVATVSVFVDSKAARRKSMLPTLARSGALNVLTTVEHGALITVMGEVPRITIKLISQALRYGKAH